jgi:hypothetical protein
MEDVGIFWGHSVYFTAIQYVLWTYGVFCGNLVYFSLFWYVVPRKIWQPCSTNEIIVLNATLVSYVLL